MHSGSNPRTQEILHLVCKEGNEVHKSVATVLDSCRLGVLFHTWTQKINTSIKNVWCRCRAASCSRGSCRH